MTLPAFLSRRRSHSPKAQLARRSEAPLVEPLEARIAPATFTNSTAITLNDDTAGTGTASTAASPNPSTINVSGTVGTITDVNVTLTGVTEARASDLDILLVSPTGQTFVLVSDAGGNGAAISNVTITFDDSAAGTLEDSTGTLGWGTGTTSFKPANHSGTGDTFPSPAPAGPYNHPSPGGSATLASVFNGLNANGTWSLYIVDDGVGGGNGSVAGGWSLDITTAGAAAATTTTLVTNNPQSFTQAPDNTVTLTATVTSGATVNAGSVTFTDLQTGAVLAANVPVSASGVATHTLAFGSEGTRNIQAVYNGTASFATSTGTVAQEVNNQTNVLGGGQFANDFSALTINDSPSLGAFGTATPYASKIFVSGQSGTITGLTVTLTNINSAQPDDLDLLLVGPGGQTIVLMSDSGGINALSNTTISFADSAASNLPDSTTITAGTYKPTNLGAGGDTFPAPAPAASAATTLAGAFNGISPNGEWQLFVVDDSVGGGGGTFAGGWKLAFTTAVAAATTTTLTTNNPQSLTQGATDTQVTLTATVTSGSTVNTGSVTFTDLQTGAVIASNVAVSNGVASVPNYVFTTEGTRNVQAVYNGNATFGTSSDTEVQEVNNPTVVSGNNFSNNLSGFTIKDSPSVGQAGTALPYASKIFVTGVNLVDTVTVTLTGLNSPRPDDLDFLLVSPSGQSIVLMSDNGGLSTTGPITLTFADAGASTLPDDTTISSGTYKPSNVGTGDTFPSPAPAPSAATTLASFTGTAGNGEWKLFVVDDSLGGGDSQVTGGWTLNITALNTAPTLLDTNVSAGTVAATAGVPSGAVGTLVSSLADLNPPVGQQDNVTDPDTNPLTGVAITGANTTNGQWFYSTNNGTTWNALGGVSGASSRLLAADASTRVYFQPNGTFAGQISDGLTFRAWDRTSGTNGALANTTTNGGTTAFSNTTDVAAVTVNDSINLSIGSTTSVAEDSGGNLVYTFTRLGTTGTLTTNFTVSGGAVFTGNAAADTDYTQSGAASFTATTGTVTFAAGSQTATVTITPKADTTVESNENVVLTVATGTGYAVAPTGSTSGTGTIVNDDTDVSVAVAPASVSEDGAGNLVYTFTRNGVTSGTLTTNIQVSGTASVGGDYTIPSITGGNISAITGGLGTITFSAGSSTVVVTVDPTADTTVEADETAIFTVLSGTNYNATGSPASGTITNDDADVTLAVAPASVTEDGAGNLVYTFTRSGFTTNAQTVNFTVGGTATFATDYTQSGAATFTTTTGTVTFAAGATTATVTLDPSVDTTVEGDETTLLTLAAGTGYNVVTAGAVQGTILNDDTDVSVSVAPSSVTEDGAGNLVYTFTRNGVTTGALTANFSVGGGATFGTDYSQSGAATFTTTTGTVTFAAGATTATVTIDPTADTLAEGDETAVLTVTSGTGYNVTGGAATGTITNDDTNISVAVAPASVAEDGATNLVYTFTRTGVTTGSTTVNFSVGGAATFGTDYAQSGAATFTATAGTVTFAAGETTKTVTVDPTADVTVEANEDVVLTITTGTGYTGVGPAATGTITNDDADVTLAVAPTSVTEDGVTNLVYTFTRTGLTTNALTVNFSVGGTATFGSDYGQSGAATFTTTTGTVTFTAGSSTATVIVDPTTDTNAEGDENVLLSITAGTGYGIGTTSSASGTILDDDTTVAVTIGATTSVGEGSGTGLVYTFTRTGATTGALPINFTPGGTTATSGDYNATSSAATFNYGAGTLTIPAGSSSVTVTLTPVNDSVVEGSETAILTVAAGAGYGIAGSPATGTITDDDSATIGYSATTSTIAESGANDPLGFVLTITPGTGSSGTPSLARDVTFNVTTVTAGSTATGGGTDYTLPTLVTFNSGALNLATRTANLAIVDDFRVEGSEIANLGLAIGTDNTGGRVTIAGGAAASHATTITDNDTATVTFISTASTIGENAASVTQRVVLTISATGTGGAIVLDRDITANFSGSGAALAGSDYTLPAAVTFNAGSGPGTQKDVTIAITDDRLVEGTEAAQLTLGIATDGTGGSVSVGVNPSHTVTITDNDTATIGFTAGTSSVGENGGTQNVGVTLTLNTTGTTAANTAGLGSALTVDLTTGAGGTATGLGTDYTLPTSPAVTFAAGTYTAPTTLNAAVTIANDARVEGSETANLGLNIAQNIGTQVSLGGTTAHTLTITDDDIARIRFNNNASTIGEAAGPESLDLVLSITAGAGSVGTPTLDRAVTVDVTNGAGGTALSGTDFTLPAVATFAVGAGNLSTQTVSLSINNDTLVEGSETAALALAINTDGTSGQAGIATGMNATHTTTITDNDTATISFAAPGSSVTETMTVHPVGVTLVTTANGVVGGGSLARAISVTASDLATGTATGTGTDYTFNSQVVTFGIGATDSTQTVSMAIVGDLVSEGNETVNLSLGTLNDGTNGQATIIAPSGHTVTILDNDIDLQVTKTESIATVIAGSGTGNLVYTITVKNNGLLTATGLFFNEDLTLPAGVTLDSVVPSSGTFTTTVSPDGTWVIPTLAPGASETLTVTLTAGASAANAAIVGDTVTITSSDQVRVNTGDDFATETTPIATQADLALTKGDSPDPVLPGANVTYTINFTNNGPSDAQTLVITDNVPAGTTFVSATAPGGWVPTTPAVGGTGAMTFTKTSAATGETGTFTIVVKTDANTGGMTLTNTATVSSATQDLVTGNDSATATTLVAGTDLVLTKTDSINTTTPGSTLTYALSYSNAGFTAATGVVLTETLPVGTTFNSAASTAGWTETAPGSGVFKLTVGTVAIGGTGSANFAVTVNAIVAAGQASIVNTATIGDDGASGTDLNPGDNTATDTNVLNAAPDLQLVSKSDGTALLVPGATSTYTINFANIGNQGATGVVIQDTLPVGTSFIAGENPGWTQVGNLLTYNVGSLAGGATSSVMLVLHVDNPLPPGVIQVINTATIVDDDANGADPAANDSASDTNLFSIPINLINGRTARFVDVDGDLVTVRVSKGTLEQNDFVLVPSGVGAQLLLVNFSDDGAEFKNANLTITAAKVKGGSGNGMVNVGHINAAGVDLAAVRVTGDLGQVDAGDATLTTTGLQNLVVGSLGVVPNTQLPGAMNPLHSEIQGKLGSFVSRGNVVGVVDVTGGANGSIGRVNILGNLDGSSGGVEAGLIRSTGGVGPFNVKGDMIGGANFSGLISGGKVGQIIVKGDLTSADATRPVLIAALGDLAPLNQFRSIAINGVQVFGDVANARVLAGYDYVAGAPAALVPTNFDASIGTIAVLGSWASSSAVAGVADSTADGFGRNDTLFAGDTTPNIVASIASITIKGSAGGSAAPGDHYGLTAQRIAKIKIGAATVPLTTGANDLPLDTTNNDFRAVDFV